jgi:hypothetical protein
MQQFDARAVMAARIAQECRPEELRRAGPAPTDAGAAAPQGVAGGAVRARTASALRPAAEGAGFASGRPRAASANG